MTIVSCILMIVMIWGFYILYVAAISFYARGVSTWPLFWQDLKARWRKT